MNTLWFAWRQLWKQHRHNLSVGALSTYDLLNPLHAEREIRAHLRHGNDGDEIRRDFARIGNDLRAALDRHA